MAKIEVQKLGKPVFDARVNLAEGDLARSSAEHEEALTLYRQGLKHLDITDHPETRFRLHLRIGDILQAQRKYPQRATQNRRRWIWSQRATRS